MPPFVPDLVDEFVESMLSTQVGDDNYPGDHVPTDAWPGIALGSRGVLNTMAPTNFRLDDLPEIEPKPSIAWIRGSHDQIVSDRSVFDLAYLGSVGAVPGWPGADVAPPQPMVAQTWAVLDRYAAAGGSLAEIVVDGSGHTPARREAQGVRGSTAVRPRLSSSALLEGEQVSPIPIGNVVPDVVVSGA